MLKERTISFTKIYIPSDAPEKVQKDLKSIKSVTVYFDSIAQINEFNDYTEIHTVYPFNPFVEISNPETQVFQILDSKAAVEKMIEEKKENLHKLAEKEKKDKLTFMEKQAQISAGVAKQMGNTGKNNIISGNGFGAPN